MSKCVCLSVCLAVAVVLGASASPVRAETLERRGSLARIAVSEATTAPVVVPRWDPTSPQQLVRLDGKLYQQDSDFYYPVVDDLITVRLADGVADWADLLRRARLAAPQTFEPLATLVKQRENRLNIIDLRLPAGEDPADWCELLHRTGLVRYAEVNTHGVYLLTPGDAQYSSQWALNNTGQTGGTPGADLRAQSAWDISTGDPSVIVGVLDSGTFVDHVDLAANVWHNPGEIAGNSVDDDGNGYVDDFEGWDFGNANNDPRSSNFHGTHVTGIINAATDNGIGVAGLAGGFGGGGVRGMAVAVGESGPNGAVLDDAILYAADNGASVITMSLSVGSSSAINDALDYAYNTRDVFIDCAAGNSGSSVAYPANRPEVMAVASTDDGDNHSSFSNPGPQVEVAAPGSSILSTQLNNNYGTSSGTSFSAPYVAGLAALIRSVSPGLPAADVRQVIIDSADDVESAGFDNLTGFGRINAFAALSMLATSDGTITLDGGMYSCQSQVTITVSDVDLAGSGSISVTARSNVEVAGESVILPETGPSTGIFRGTLQTSGAAPATDNLLQVVHADTIVIEYFDADTGQGAGLLKAKTAGTDCLPPLISGISVTSIDDNSAEIVWSTDELATSLVRYGETTSPSLEAVSTALTTSHSLTLNGLTDCTLYRFEIESADPLTNTGADDNGGLLFSFQTYGDFPGVGVVPCRQGQAALDKGDYGCDAVVQISVTDLDLDTDPQAAETIQVLMTSTSEPDGEWITLNEIGPNSLVFDGSVDLAATATPEDGMLAAASGDLITVTYFDADNGEGGSGVATATAIADCAPPKIDGVQLVAVSATRAEVIWSTDEPASSRIDFGPTAGLGASVEDPGLKTSHRLTLSAFEECERVYFRLSGIDANGNPVVGDAAGTPYEFNLKQIGGKLFHDNFEVDNGWTTTGEWTRAAPQGLGSDGSDPEQAYSGASILGNDLSGGGSFPGDYEPAVKEWARSPVFTTSGAANAELIFRRKLGVDAGDKARISVFSPGESLIWESSGAVDDSDWVEIRYDLGAAGNQTDVQVRFLVQSDNPGQSYGWNIDEVVVKDATQPDYLSCGGCVGTPTFGGLKAVYDPDPCASTGLTLEWDAAPAWGSGLGGTYDIHRGVSSGFVPDAGNRIASGIVGTTWVDLTAPVDTPVWYVVRARNDESCGGGEGLAEANVSRRTATETIDQLLPGTVGNSVRTTDVGSAHVRISWDPIPGASSYVVRRSVTPDYAAPVEVGTTEANFFEDVNAAIAPPFLGYRVFAVNSCDEEE